MASLNISFNQMATKEAGKALADALAANSTLKELDVSKNTDRGDGYDFDGADGPGFAKELAIGVGANGALAKVDISRNALCAAGGTALAEGLKDNQTITELNLADNSLGKVGTGPCRSDMSGVVAIADAATDCCCRCCLGLIFALPPPGSLCGGRVC